MDYNNKQNKLSRRRVLALVTVIVVVFSLYEIGRASCRERV